MALRRVASTVLSTCPANLSRASGLSKFSSQNGNWTLTTTPRRGLGELRRKAGPCSLQIPSHSQSSRHFSSSPTSHHGHLDPPKPGEERKITFIDRDGQSHTFKVSDGDNLLDIAQAHDLEMEGACGGSCACSTCHVIVEDESYYGKMDEPDDEENDMLDLAFGLTETSRLGCQVRMTRDLDGLVVKLPNMTRNLQASDFK